MILIQAALHRSDPLHVPDSPQHHDLPRPQEQQHEEITEERLGGQESQQSVRHHDCHR